jgi:hypothetical protein
LAIAVAGPMRATMSVLAINPKRVINVRMIKPPDHSKKKINAP